MKACWLLPLLLLASVDAHRVRVLLQGNDASVASNGVATASRRGRGNSNKDGRVFNFAAVPEGARGFLNSIEATNPGKVERIIAKANWRKGRDDLVEELNEDPDLVG